MGAPPSVHGGEYEQSAPPPAFAAFPPMHGFGAGGVGGGGGGGQPQHDPSVQFISFRQMIREAPDDVLHIIERDGEGGNGVRWCSRACTARCDGCNKVLSMTERHCKGAMWGGRGWVERTAQGHWGVNRRLMTCCASRACPCGGKRRGRRRGGRGRVVREGLSRGKASRRRAPGWHEAPRESDVSWSVTVRGGCGRSRSEAGAGSRKGQKSAGRGAQGSWRGKRRFMTYCTSGG